MKVKYDSIEKFDVVSIEVVKEMLEGLKEISDSQVLCTVSGYASGYLDNKGKVCYAFSILNDVYAKEEIIDGDRNEVREISVNHILNDIYEKLKERQ